MQKVEREESSSESSEAESESEFEFLSLSLSPFDLHKRKEYAADPQTVVGLLYMGSLSTMNVMIVVMCK